MWIKKNETLKETIVTYKLKPSYPHLLDNSDTWTGFLVIEYKTKYLEF